MNKKADHHLLDYGLAYLHLMHAWPVTVVVFVTFIIALFATRNDNPRPWEQIMLVVLAIFLSQYSVGAGNEYADRHADLSCKPDKPIPSGLVPARVALALAMGSGLAATLVTLPFGWLPAAITTLGTLIGLLYNLGLKKTPLSWLPYTLGFPLLPLWVFYTLSAWEPVLLWLFLIAGFLIVGTHLANTLPDVELDKAQGEHGLAVVLGKQQALVACWGCYLCAPIVALLPLYWHPYNMAWFLPGTILSLLITLTTILLYRHSPTRATLKRNWQLLTIGAAALGAGWLGAILY